MRFHPGPGSLGPLVLLVVWGCQTGAPPFDLFVAPPSESAGKVTRIAVVPTLVPRELGEVETVIAAFDSAVGATLVGMGLSIVPSGEYHAVWSRITQEAGGFFDPFTGVRDDGKFEAGVAQLTRELRERFDVDGFLYPELWIGEAPLYGNEARWDGVTERVAIPRGTADLFVPSEILALSFVVAVEDVEGAELFMNGRGFRVLQHLTGSDDDYENPEYRPVAELLADTAYVHRTVAMVLAPLVRLMPGARPAVSQSARARGAGRGVDLTRRSAVANLATAKCKPFNEIRPCRS